jgi:uncharacterized protein (DUF1800 family)
VPTATEVRAGFDTTLGIRARVVHLYRRAGFGATEAQIAAAIARGYRATVEQLLTAADPAAEAIAAPALTPAPLPFLNEDAEKLEGVTLLAWWIQRMVASEVPLREKLPLFWHGLFTSALQKSKWPSLMLAQNQTFRTLGWGNFETFTRAMTTDPAMLLWLDLLGSGKAAPNENYARELMELFALGRVNQNGAPNYTEDDVKAAASALTGWVYNPFTQQIAFAADRFDPSTKAFLGQTGAWGTDDVARIVTHHPASARWIPTKLWSFFAYPLAPSDPIITDLASTYAVDLDITHLLRRIFLHAGFQSVTARTGLIKTPVEWVVGAFRSLQIPVNLVTAQAVAPLQQVPFHPPNVAGWPQNGYWITTATALERIRIAQAAATFGDTTPVDAAAPQDRAQAAAALLGVAAWTPRTRAALN